ncbi:MAG: hypothetical protein GIKADHBN_03284 [Phycisphaerales bacterium]|nr:hypothetical protein [Phycisphaerales bacterium]
MPIVRAAPPLTLVPDGLYHVRFTRGFSLVRDQTMIKLAFSSVACPERTLRDVAALGESVGAQGVELRTFGSASTNFACDPALSDPAKVAKLFADAGTQICCVSTSCRFDEPVAPAVVGRLFVDTEKEVRAAKYAIDLASELGASHVRVFGFESPAGVSLSDTTKVVVERLVKVCDHARNRRVSVVIENGGSYATATDLAALIDLVQSPLLGAEYNMAVAHQAGESAANGVNVLGDRLWIAKLKDFRGALPCAVGEGDMACHEAVRALVSARFNGWAVYEYDRAWLGGDTGQPVGSAMEMIRDSFATICRWMQEMGAGFGTGGRSPVRPVAVAS